MNSDRLSAMTASLGSLKFVTIIKGSTLLCQIEYRVPTIKQQTLRFNFPTAFLT